MTFATSCTTAALLVATATSAPALATCRYRGPRLPPPPSVRERCEFLAGWPGGAVPVRLRVGCRPRPVLTAPRGLRLCCDQPDRLTGRTVAVPLDLTPYIDP